MSANWVTPADLERLGISLGQTADSLATWEAVTCGLLHDFGYTATARGISATLQRSQGFVDSWRRSLLRRLALLEDQQRVPVGAGAPMILAGDQGLQAGNRGDALWQLFRGIPAPAPPAAIGGGNGRAGSTAAGEILAGALLDALETHDLGRILALLDRLLLHLTDEDFVLGVFHTLGPERTGQFPLLIMNLGADIVDLHRYLAPLAAALAVAVGTGRLPFTAGDLFAGNGGRGLTAAAYFDFAAFEAGFVAGAATAFLPAFRSQEVPLHGVPYLLPDGRYAEDDPRLPIVRALLALETAEQRVALIALTAEGLLPALVIPATPYGDGGRAVGLLLESLATSPDTATTATIAALVDAAGSGVQAGIALGAANAVMPHLTALIAGTRYGRRHVDLPQSALRRDLDGLDDPQAVPAFVAAIVAHEASRAALNDALALLIAATFAAFIDPDDPASLAAPADDLGALLRLVLTAEIDDDLRAGRARDDTNEAMHALFGDALGLLGSGLVRLAVTADLDNWLINRLPAIARAGPPIAGAAGHTDGHGEYALLRGYDTQRAWVDLVVFAVAAELHRLGRIRLPRSLLNGGEPVVPNDPAGWDALLAAMEEAGYDPETWFNHAVAIAGYAIPAPSG